MNFLRHRTKQVDRSTTTVDKHEIHAHDNGDEYDDDDDLADAHETDGGWISFWTLFALFSGVNMLSAMFSPISDW